MPEYSGEVTHVEFALVPLWLIAALPFAGAVVNALFGRWLQRSKWQTALGKRLHIGSPAVTAVAVGAMLGAFVLTLVCFFQLWSLDPERRYLWSYAWDMIRIGSLDVNFAFAMDPLSALMALIITFIGGLIHVYAAAYMAKDPDYWRFFCYLNLFVFAMLLLVLGDNFIVMFFGWEGVGLCSYLLIGFWYKDYKKATCGMKAFVVNRIGDWGFVCGVALLFWGLGGSWLADSTDYISDYRPRFVAVEKQLLSSHGAAHEQSGHAPGGHSPGGHAPTGPHGRAAPPPNGSGPEGPELPQVVPAAWQPEPGAHEQPGTRPPRDEIDEPTLPTPPRRPPPKEPVLHAGGMGFLSMTTHPGARVYLGVHTYEQLRTLGQLPDCSTRPSWNDANAPQIAPDCYAVSPFLRKRVPATMHAIAVMPGGGAVVSGDGTEAASLRIRVERDHEALIAPLGSTLTFREIHDQLVLKDASGKTFIKDALKEKSVWGISLLTLACLLFFVGATGKSAQLPLYTWLPDAMAGPTPVSALIHAATMVTAGVYMIARLNFLFGLTPTASGVVALVGALTALFAATIGFFQYDIKKVLAYSTVSQLGFMFMGVGVGAYWAGVFHLMTHACFKACLFLGSGSVIHGMHHAVHDEAGSQDMRNMGGLRAVMPLTARTYFVACLAITAAPVPFLAGFWSKDEILWKAFNSQHLGFVPGWLIFAIGLVAAVGTSFYMWRSYYLTFEGKHAVKKIKTKVKESPQAITWVLATLAFLSAATGVVFGISSHFTSGLFAGLLPDEPLLEAWLHPVTAHNEVAFRNWDSTGREHLVMYVLMAASVIAAIGAWSLAVLRYGAGRPKDWEAQERKLPAFQLLHDKYRVDEFYQATFVAATLKLRLVFAEMDRWIVDGIVNGTAVMARGASWVTGAIDNYIVDGVVNFVAEGTLAAGQKLRGLQTGRVQNYVYGILGGVAVLAIIQYFLG